MTTTTPTAGATPVAQRPHLVDASWLEAHVSDPMVRVVEVDVSPAAYEEWHVPGAALWNVYTDLKTPDYRTVGEPEVAALLARSGITPETTVVLYGYAPALGLWLLEHYGHPDARILDCSRDSWRNARRPAATGAAPDRTPTTAAYGPHVVDDRMRADRARVQEAIHDPGVTVLDVRSAAEYDGECFWPSGGLEPGGRAGHVPHAVHLPLDAGCGLYDSRGAFRADTELREVLAPVDLDATGDLITYCTIGGRAATAWFVLTHVLGRRGVRVYDGSWAEWGHLLDAPVETRGAAQEGVGGDRGES